jgi:hypothetical protein
MTKPKSVVETEKSVRTAMADEICVAMAGGKTLTSNELVDLCGSAHDSTDVGRVIYWLRQQGQVRQDGTRNGVKAWTLVSSDAPAMPDPIDAELIVELAKATAADIQDTDTTTQEADIMTVQMPSEDTKTKEEGYLDLALASLLDAADDACLAYADSKLSTDANWAALRALQAAAFNAQCEDQATRMNASNGCCGECKS